MILRIGCAGFALSQSTYVARFGLVEIEQTFHQPPRAQTARRWREQSPAGFQFTMQAWQLITHEPGSPGYSRLAQPIPPGLADHYGGFRDTDEVRAAWETTRAIADILDARVILFQTPPSFTPTSTHRTRLERFFRDLPRDGRLLAWEPHGVWEPGEVRALCGALDLIHCVDPVQQTTTTAGVAYYRLYGLGGGRGALGERALEKTLLACEGFGEAYVLFNNAQRAVDARRFQALAEELLNE
jgi:uncharacterized protein YecE (DUF72 family)